MKAVEITAEDKALMETLLSAGHIEHTFAVRLQTVLLRSQGERYNTIVRFLGISVSAVTSYINRYLNDGIESLLHDKTRKPGKEKISQEIRDEICRLVCTEKPANAYLESIPGRFKVHFTPTYSSWLNVVERWFAEITNKSIRRGSYASLGELIQAIKEYIKHWNQSGRSFTWTKKPEEIITKINKALLS